GPIRPRPPAPAPPKAAPAPPPPEAAALPPPPPPPEHDEVVLPEKPQALPKQHEKPKPKPKPREEVFKEPPKKKEENLDDLLADLRGKDTTKPAPAPAQAPAQTAAVAPAAGPTEGTVVSAEELAWQQRVKRRVRDVWVLQQGFRTQPLVTIVVVTLDSEGNISGSPRITKKSGNPWYDESVMRGITKANPLPKPPKAGDWTLQMEPGDSL